MITIQSVSADSHYFEKDAGKSEPVLWFVGLLGGIMRFFVFVCGLLGWRVDRQSRQQGGRGINTLSLKEKAQRGRYPRVAGGEPKAKADER